MARSLRRASRERFFDDLPAMPAADLVIRRATAADASSIATIWYRGWWDAHEGNVPNDLSAIRITAQRADFR